MNPWLARWVHFLFSTPKRCIWTAVVLFALLLVVVPGMGESLANRLAVALAPVIQLILVLAICAAVVTALYKKAVGGSGGKKK